MRPLLKKFTFFRVVTIHSEAEDSFQLTLDWMRPVQKNVKKLSGHPFRLFAVRFPKIERNRTLDILYKNQSSEIRHEILYTGNVAL